MNDLKNFKTHFKNTYVYSLYFQELYHKKIVKIFVMIASMIKVMLFFEALENRMNRKCCLSLNMQAVYSERNRIISI